MRIKRVIFFTFFSISIIFSIDSDGDGYSDQLELTIGTDPQNAQDRYYYGYWPFNLNKDKIKGAEIPINCPSNISCECTSNDDCLNSNCQKTIRGGYYCIPKPGDTFPHFIAVDQYGEFVDIYDFSMQGKIIVVEFGAAWCSPCHDLSNWLSTGDNSAIINNRWWKKEYEIIREKINKDEIIFITILFQDESKDNASYTTVMNWHTKYPNSKIPILADEYADIHKWIKPTGYPCINILDENMRLINFTTRGLTEAFDILSGLKTMPKID
tara:strand:+ start:1768 stop:2574 length:807 start_codon:yes stop_codon:yes gene_type:complete